MKKDAGGAIVKLEQALGMSRHLGDDEAIAIVAEELARALLRRQSVARSLYCARLATKRGPNHREAWNTLAKACELVASRLSGPSKQRRAKVLYRAAATAFSRAAALTKDPEDRRWLVELSEDAARQAK